MSIIVVPKYSKLGQGFSKKEQLKAYEHRGRNTKLQGYQSPASWIMDKADSRRIIVLCSFCKNRFNYKKNKYLRRFTPDHTGKSSGYAVNGMCDGCKQNTMRIDSEKGGTCFVAEENWEKVSMDPSLAKRRAQAMWKRYGVKTKVKDILSDQINNPGKWGYKHNTAYNENVKKYKLKVTDKRRFT